MAIRELRIDPDCVLLLLIAANGTPPLPSDAKVTDVALDHGHTATHRDRPPTMVLQISSGEFGPQESSGPLPPMSFKR